MIHSFFKFLFDNESLEFISDSRLKKEKIAKFPELYMQTLQHVSTITTGILQQIEDESSVLTNVPQTLVNSLLQKVGASDSRYVYKCR
jgi:hypothetical protein